jgi:glyoxylase-like metal-dependent hydrolase (beta-lactamase superfamily II)
VNGIEVVPIEVSTFRFPDPALADREGVVIAYAVRHREGTLLFDTGFGFGDAGIEAAYAPRTRRIVEALGAAGIATSAITEVVNCHLHADHAGQNAAFPGVPIYVQPAEWELAHTTDHTILDWVDRPGLDYRQVEGDHEVAPEVRVVATPGHTAGHQSLVLATPDGPIVLAGQACYTAGEWAGDRAALEGRSGAPDRDAYDRSIERLRGLRPSRVYFGHDRMAWTAEPGARATPAILPGPC